MTAVQPRECEYGRNVVEGRGKVSTFITTEADESTDKPCSLRKFQPSNGTLPHKENNENGHMKAELKAMESESYCSVETGDKFPATSMQDHSSLSYSCGAKPKNRSNESGSGSGSHSGSSGSKSQKQKSGSESSSSGRGSTSSHHQSHQGGGIRGLGSSGDSDENDDDDKRRKPQRGLNKEPKSRVSFAEDDDEATDSADEGRSDEVMEYPNVGYTSPGVGMHKNVPGKSGGSLRQTTPGTITVESVVPGVIGSTLMLGPQLGSPINMAVGYGISESMAPRMMDKSPSGSGSQMGTPTLDSPRPSDGQVTPGTPVLSPVIAPVSQVGSTCTHTHMHTHAHTHAHTHTHSVTHTHTQCHTHTHTVSHTHTHTNIVNGDFTRLPTTWLGL